MNIQRKLLTRNPYSRPGTYINSVKGIVIHWVANPGTSAIQNRNYFENLKNQTAKTARYASAHFIVGLAGEVIQCIPVTERAYHVGAPKYTETALEKLSSYPNNCTLGIELCHPDSSGRFTPETLDSAAALAAKLCRFFNLEPEKALFRHYDITGKNCPKYFVNHEAEWQLFKIDAARRADTTDGEQITAEAL